MKLLGKLVSSFKPLIIFSKIPILYILQGPRVRFCVVRKSRLSIIREYAKEKVHIFVYFKWWYWYVCFHLVCYIFFLPMYFLNKVFSKETLRNFMEFFIWTLLKHDVCFHFVCYIFFTAAFFKQSFHKENAMEFYGIFFWTLLKHRVSLWLK